jgi:hypothetical protein
MADLLGLPISREVAEG